MMNKFLSLIIVCFLLSMQDDVFADDSSGLVDKKKYEWVVEEILNQVVELRREVGQLKDDMQAINKRIDDLAQSKGRRRSSMPEEVILGENVLGDRGASYAIVEFSDFQCPYCARHAENVLPRIKEELVDTGKVQYAVRDYPLSFHSQAKGAAIAADCAGAQGKYWAMHETLFANQGRLGDELYQATASKLGLDLPIFEQCLNDPESERAVEQDMAYGNSLGVTGTPKFFVGKLEGNTIINVRVISGAQQYRAFKKVIAQLGNHG